MLVPMQLVIMLLISVTGHLFWRGGSTNGKLSQLGRLLGFVQVARIFLTLPPDSDTQKSETSAKSLCSTIFAILFHQSHSK